MAVLSKPILCVTLLPAALAAPASQASKTHEGTYAANETSRHSSIVLALATPTSAQDFRLRRSYKTVVTDHPYSDGNGAVPDSSTTKGVHLYDPMEDIQVPGEGGDIFVPGMPSVSVPVERPMASHTIGHIEPRATAMVNLMTAFVSAMVSINEPYRPVNVSMKYARPTPHDTETANGKRGPVHVERAEPDEAPQITRLQIAMIMKTFDNMSEEGAKDNVREKIQEVQAAQSIDGEKAQDVLADVNEMKKEELRIIMELSIATMFEPRNQQFVDDTLKDPKVSSLVKSMWGKFGKMADDGELNIPLVRESQPTPPDGTAIGFPPVGYLWPDPCEQSDLEKHQPQRPRGLEALQISTRPTSG